MKPNGSGARKCYSWIEAFVETTENLEAPEIFRRWAAITALSAVLEQKVWLLTTSRLHPNLYAFLVGHPGVGKTKTIRGVKQYLAEVPEFTIAPQSLTPASLVDAMTSAKRFEPMVGEEPLEYNNMFVVADELTVFMHEYSNQMVGLLSAFYDPDPYGENRRGKEIRIKIKSPSLAMLCGTTPSNLLKFVPDFAWDQGFMSRVILIFSDERVQGDIWQPTTTGLDADLWHDVVLISQLKGQFSATQDYRKAIDNWRKTQLHPAPTHPKLLHYNTRRLAHLFKLSMISSVDLGPNLILTAEDFNRAYEWLTLAERNMADVFKAGTPGVDSKVMDEAYHMVMVSARPVPHSGLIRFLAARLPSHSVDRVITNMVNAGMLFNEGGYWSAKPPTD